MKQETMMTDARANHANIYEALAGAQLEFGAVTKGAVNPAFKSRYANLADVAGVVIPTLARHGVAVMHYLVRDDLSAMRTEFAHGASGTNVRCDVPLIVSKNDMQGMKSATTYAKRIGLESLSGIAPEDDDGNAAAAAAPPRQTRAEPPLSQQAGATKTAERVLTKAEGDTILAAINACETPVAVAGYMNSLRAGPMSFAAEHPKIKAAADARTDALAPFPGDQGETHPALAGDNLPY